MNKQFAVELLRREGTFFVHLNPRDPHVVVPPWLRHQDHIVLSFGDNCPIPIPDLRVDRDGVFGTLQFSCTKWACFIPWSAVFAVIGDNGRGMIWEEYMPDSVRSEVSRNKAVRGLPWPERSKPGLRSVPNCGKRRGPPRRGHLSLVRSPDQSSGSGTYPRAR